MSSETLIASSCCGLLYVSMYMIRKVRPLQQSVEKSWTDFWSDVLSSVIPESVSTGWHWLLPQGLNLPELCSSWCNLNRNISTSFHVSRHHTPWIIHEFRIIWHSALSRCLTLSHSTVSRLGVPGGRRLNGRRHCNWWHRRHLGMETHHRNSRHSQGVGQLWKHSLNLPSLTDVIQWAQVAHLTHLWLQQSSERGQWTCCLCGLIPLVECLWCIERRVGHFMTSNHLWNMQRES